METTYCIGTANRFSLLFENESDPLETTIKVQDKDFKKKTKVSEKENKGKPDAQAKTKTTQPPRKVIKDNNHKVQENKREGDGKQSSRTENPTKTERPFNKFSNENREERNNRRNREERAENGSGFENTRDREEKPKRDNGAGGDFENRKGRGGGNKGPGGRGGARRVEERRGKREFDRQSGSDKTHGYRGVKPIDKRDGGGAHNWGSTKDIIDEADQSKVTDSDSTWTDTEKADPATTVNEPKGEGEGDAESVPVEEACKELTLDEWKAQRAIRQKPTYNVRKAGEGEDPSQWKKMYELNRKKGQDDESEEEEYDTSEYPQRVGRQKHVIGIDFHFNDSSKRGGTGRGRGARAGRGARVNRGDNRSDKPGSGGNNRFRTDETRVDDRHDPRNALKVDDERDFPSLS